MRVVAVAGAKGGVGKSAAAVNLAFLSAATGLRTLLWDLDPQGAATHCYRMKSRVKGGASRLLGAKRDLQSFTRSTDFERLDVLPADGSFRVVDTVLGTRRWPERVIRKLIRPLDRTYDVVILDCAPGLGVVTEAVVAASDLVLAPIVPAPLAVRSLDQLAGFVGEQRSGLPVLAFLSMVDERKVLHRQMLDLVRSDRRFALSAVPVSSAVERMGLEQVPAVLASPRNLAATAYRNLWAEIAERLGIDAEFPAAPPVSLAPGSAAGESGSTELTPTSLASATEPVQEEPVASPPPLVVSDALPGGDAAASGSDPADVAADPFAGWFVDAPRPDAVSSDAQPPEA